MSEVQAEQETRGCRPPRSPGEKDYEYRRRMFDKYVNGDKTRTVSNGTDQPDYVDPDTQSKWVAWIACWRFWNMPEATTSIDDRDHPFGLE